MPTDPNHGALLRAVEKLTTQVRRIADTLADGTVQDSFALAPPVVTDDDGAQTTADDTPAWKLCTCGDKPVTARHPEPCPLSREPYASELAEMHGTPWPARPYKMCSATTTNPSGQPLGPCVLQYQHDEPIHQDAEGAYWAQPGGGDTPKTRGAEKQRTIRRQQFRLLLNQLNDGTTPLTPAQVQALTAYVADEIVECNMETQEADRLEAEAADWKATAAVYSGLHRTAENELKQAHAELAEATAAIERVRAIRPSPPRSEFNARTNAQDEGWDQALATVRAALLGPIAEG
ncbi:hypothetical protein ACIQJW_26740 [Streptomyces californicus]|nr:hypothetical protein ADK33_03415 [Streptomyces griseus subsp. rhodochrous]